MNRPTCTVTAVVLSLGLLMFSACADDGDGDDAAPAETDDGAAAGAGDGTTSSSVAPAGPPPYATPAEMAAALGCTDYADGRLDGGPLEHRQATGDCTFEGAEVTLDVFASAEDVAAYEEVGETAGCDALVGAGYTEYSYAIGDRWAAAVFDLEPDLAITDSMAGLLGGESRTMTC
jgi:hypothetical protein